MRRTEALNRSPRHGGALRTLTRALMVAGVAALATLAVFVDELVHREPLGDTLAGDAIAGVLLAATAICASLVVLRLSDSRQALDRGLRMVEAVGSVSEHGHIATTLSALTRQAAEMVGATRVCVFMRDDADAGAYVAAAGHGSEAMVGRRFPIEEGLVGRVLATGEPALASGELCVPITWGGHVRGAMSAVADRDTLDRRDLDVLARLAELGAVALEHAATRGNLERSAQAGVEALAAAADVRDSYTADHAERVVELAVGVGQELGLDASALTEVEVAARLHDVGKIGVPDGILRKPGALEPEEFDIVKRHPEWGAQMLARVPELAGAAPAVRAAHERWDGNGYPDGLRAEQIPLASRVIFVCDAFEAMTSDRPYRPALGAQAAIHELRKNAASQFDPAVVEALERLLD